MILQGSGEAGSWTIRIITLWTAGDERIVFMHHGTPDRSEQQPGQQDTSEHTADLI